GRRHAGRGRAAALGRGTQAPHEADHRGAPQARSVMIGVSGWFLSASAAVMLVFKITMLFALAALVATLLWRRSAAARHLAWLAALAGSIALAPLALVAPRLHVNLPAAAMRAMPRLVPSSLAPETRHEALRT